jgi:hypothetical protein
MTAVADLMIDTLAAARVERIEICVIEFAINGGVIVEGIPCV